MKFFKENSYDIVRLLINQIGIAIFSLILYTAVGMVNLESGTKLGINIALSVFAILFYFSLLYTVAWDWGAKDKIRIDGGRMAPVRFKGLKMALFANIPNFILAAICAFTFLIYFLSDNQACYTISTLFNTIVRLFMSMYLGVLQGIFAALKSNTDLYYLLQAFGYLIMPIFAILSTELGYAFGVKEKKIFGYTVKNKKQ